MPKKIVSDHEKLGMVVEVLIKERKRVELINNGVDLVQGTDYQNAVDVKNAITKSGKSIVKNAENILNKLTYPLQKEDEYEAVEVPVNDLGKNLTWRQVLKKGKEKGYVLIPFSTGFDWLCNYKGKKKILFAMETISDSDPGVFHVNVDFWIGGLYLAMSYHYPRMRLDSDSVLLFGRRKVNS